MLNNHGIKFKILLNSLFSVLIFAIFLIWLSNIYWNVLLNDKKDKLQNVVEIGSSIVKGIVSPMVKTKRHQISLMHNM